MTVPGSDRIFDSLLEEMLTNQHPPDLTEQISQRLREELGPERWQAIRAVRSASSECHQATNSKTVRVSNWTSALVAVTALAAGLLLSLTAWRFWPHSAPPATGDTALASDNSAADLHRNSAEQIATKSGSSIVKSNSGRGGPVNPNLQASTADNQAADRQATDRSHASSDLPATSRLASGTELPLDKLPFDSNRKQSDFAPDTRRSDVPSVARWTDDQVVTWIDGSFKSLWQDQQVEAARLTSDADITARISLVLTGGASSLSDAAPREVASKLLQSASFAEHWADRIAKQWLRGTSAEDPRNPDGAALRAFLAQQIVARKPWNQVVASLISGQPGQPEAVFLTTLAGSDNHRLASRVGSAVLDEALACARCHDSSENGRVISTDQDEYWSLVAIFTGVDSRSSPGEPGARVLHDRQAELFADSKSPNVFFERPDGRLQAARFRLPAGDTWRTVEGARTPRESLARWIASTTVNDQATVNLAWRLVFGRPLVAQHAALDGAGLAERRKILVTLAGQFQAHDRDLGQLVEWLVASAPFRSQPLAIDRQRWLVASDEEIDQWNKAATNFALFVPHADGSGSGVSGSAVAMPRSLDTALAAVVRWSGGGEDRHTTLAQPSLQPDATRRPKTPDKLAAVQDEPSATYLLNSVQATPAQSEFISRLVTSKLTWPQQVEHIAGLVGSSGSNGKLQRAADQLLESKNGDRASALFQLLQGALLYETAL